MKQAIICFEGPSGVGKTTMGERLSNAYHIVPEVNLLFKRTGEESAYWYHERQLERYERCVKANQKSILDGDIFQPIWYNWVCNYPSNFLSKNETHQFYRTQIAEGKMAFPDMYIVFQADEKELWIRKERDTSRQRRNFDKHLKIIEPLKAYYQFLDEETDIRMKFIHYTDVETTKAKVLAEIESLSTNNINHLETFKQIEHWINERTK